MKNRLYLVGGLLLVAAVGWGGWRALQQPREPVYHGRPMGYCLAHTRYELTDPELNDLGRDPNAVPFLFPFLLKAMKRDSWVGAAYYRTWFWPKLPPSIQRRLPTPADASQRRQNAARLLGRVGPMAKPAVPALIRALREDEARAVKENAASALGDLGEWDSTAIAALTDALQDKGFFREVLV